MITKNSSNSKFKVELLADVDPTDPTLSWIYGGSSSDMRLVRLDHERLTSYYVFFSCESSGGNVEVLFNIIYTSDTKGVAVIPLRNWINTWLNTTNGWIRISVYMLDYGGTDTEDSITFDNQLYPGVSYRDLQIPIQKNEVGFPVTRGAYIMPPNVIYAPPVSGSSIAIESNITYDGDAAWKVMGTSTTVTPTGPRSNVLQMAYNAGDGVTLHYNTKTNDYPFTALPACSDKVVVRWTSLTGAVRQHVFPVVAMGYEADRVMLESPGDGVRSVRNTVEALRCRICGLTSYSYWYYLSLLTASDVHAVSVIAGVNDIDDVLSSPFSHATVEGLSGETPEGTGFYNFEFVLKMRHYDQY